MNQLQVEEMQHLWKEIYLLFLFVLASLCFGLKMGCLKLIQFWQLCASWAVEGAARSAYLVAFFPPKGKGNQPIQSPHSQ